MEVIKLVLIAFFMGSTSISAAELFSIRIFQNDFIKVKQDFHLSSGVVLYVHNMDDKERSEKKFTELVKNKVGPGVKKEAIKDTYMKAFSEIQNGPQWSSIYQDIVASAEPEEKAIRYGIRKLPAVIFNDKYITYGVTSLRESVQIFDNKVGNQ